MYSSTLSLVSPLVRKLPGSASRMRAVGHGDQQQSADSSRGRSQAELVARAAKADGESEVLAKIAEMPEPDRVIAERLHAIIKASAPALAPRTWYGMPA